jgi:hypothetical protein
LLKGYLKVSILDLFEAWRSIKQALLNQLAELRANQAKQQIRTPIELTSLIYDAIRGRVSHEALRMVEQQRKRLSEDDLPSCTGLFQKSQGLPCAHTIKALIDRNEILRLEHFHRHWLFISQKDQQLLLEPRVQSDRISQQSSQPRSSTRREPSGFELVEAATQKKVKAPSTCSRCHQTGHKMNAKVCPLRYNELLKSVHEGSVAAIVGQSEEIPEEAPEAIVEARGSVAEAPEVEAEEALEATAATTRAESAPEQLLYDDPRAIYQRYIQAREAWYKRQSRNGLRTNQLYRKAQGLPMRYPKSSYYWCLDYKQMGKRCKTATGSRDWTKEEMMAYLDWDKAEDERVEARVAEEIGNNPLANRQRGIKEIWKSVEQDIIEQEALYSNDNQAEDCIVVAV